MFFPERIASVHVSAGAARKHRPGDPRRAPCIVGNAIVKVVVHAPIFFALNMAYFMYRVWPAYIKQTTTPSVSDFIVRHAADLAPSAARVRLSSSLSRSSRTRSRIARKDAGVGDRARVCGHLRRYHLQPGSNVAHRPVT